jgi:hypothetical protein
MPPRWSQKVTYTWLFRKKSTEGLFPNNCECLVRWPSKHQGLVGQAGEGVNLPLGCGSRNAGEELDNLF